MALNISNDLPRIGLIPVPVQVLSYYSELDYKVAGQVLRLYFAALLPP